MVELIKNKDFTLPENQKDIQTFLTLASDYLGKNLEEKTKLSIGYLPILIKIFSEINKKLCDELEESLDKVLNLSGVSHLRKISCNILILIHLKGIKIA